MGILLMSVEKIIHLLNRIQQVWHTPAEPNPRSVRINIIGTTPSNIPLAVLDQFNIPKATVMDIVEYQGITEYRHLPAMVQRVLTLCANASALRGQAVAHFMSGHYTQQANDVLYFVLAPLPDGLFGIYAFIYPHMAIEG